MTPTKKSNLKEFDPAKAVKIGGAYREEDESFVPDPTHQYGTVDTSGTAGVADSRIEEVTPIFEVAKAQDRIMAARALDPDDPDVPESLVVLPQGTTIVQGDPEAARERVRSLAEEAMANPIEVGGPSLAQRQAAESGEEGSKKAETQRRSQGAGSATS
jgi:predicted dinucleotide-binding enzyme